MNVLRGGWLLLSLAAVCGPVIAAESAAPAPCRPDPFAGRTLYLRGSFNSWSAVDAQRFVWACDRYAVVSRIDGDQRFKIGDEGWSADADFGAGVGPDGLSQPLAPGGAEITRRFSGVHRFTLRMNDASDRAPRLQIEDCPAGAAPFGDSVLFLRGTPNNFAALETHAFQYACDAYYLNVDLKGPQEFRVADAAWTPAQTFGDGHAVGPGAKPWRLDFNGEHTLRLVFNAGRPTLSLGPKSFADPAVAAVTDPVANSLHFDSRNVASKSPFGAVPAGAEVRYAVDALPGVEKLTLVMEQRRLEGNQEVLDYQPLARVAMQRDAATPGPSGHHRYTARHRFDGIGVYGTWFEAEIGGRRYALQNNAQPVYWTREKGTGGRAAVAELQPAAAHPTSSIRRFRQTVYDPAFTVPDWAADAVYYTIFPDRFRNGDPGNDPVPGVTRYHDAGIELHADWTERPYKPGSGDGSDALYNNDFYGGDLAGITQKLDAIRDLGANTLYLTPIFAASSNHKYDTADYTRIDPHFGTTAEFERLCAEAARRGLRVLLDTSLNHTGADSLYFDRWRNFGGANSPGAFAGGKPNPASPYASWYRFDPLASTADGAYAGWVGIKDLPEIDKTSDSFRDFAYRAPDSIMKRWLDRGASGWRMDVAPWVPDDFWREWRSAIKQHRPDALTVAENWFDSSKYLLGDMFDSTMNYIFRNAVLAYAAGGDARVLAANLEAVREAYPPQAFHALMNLLSSHDQARALHQFGMTDGLDPVAASAQIATAKRRLRLAVTLQMAYPGAPAVYYGDEVGVTGGDDPYNRATYPWADLGGQPDLALQTDFKRLIGMRNRHPVLRRGTLLAPLHVDRQVLVLAQRFGRTWSIVATNNADVSQEVDVKLPPEMDGISLQEVSGSPTQPQQSGEPVATLAVEAARLRITLPALGAAVWAGEAASGRTAR